MDFQLVRRCQREEQRAEQKLSFIFSTLKNKYRYIKYNESFAIFFIWFS